MITIYKYPITDGTIVTPAGSTILHVNLQEGTLMAWAEVDTKTAQLEKWSVHMVGTGHPVTINSKYINTFFEEGGLVWHAYANKEQRWN